MIKCTLGTILIGREWCFDEWLYNLSEIEMPKDEMKLLWVVSDEYVDFYEPYFKELAKEFQEAELVPSPFKTYSHLDEASCSQGFYNKHWAVALNQNILYQHRKGDLFIIEDDVLPPSDAYTKLEPLCQLDKVLAATGILYSWKEEDKQNPILWYFVRENVLPEDKMNLLRKEVPDFDFSQYNPVRIPERKIGIDPIHAAGTYCMYIKDRALQDYVAIGGDGMFTGQDINLGFHITHRLYRKMLVDWSVKCGHYHKDEQGRVLVK